MTVEELQNFIADNVHANVDDKIVGEIMSDAAMYTNNHADIGINICEIHST